ncbi:hypothetical protein KIW84_060974 [Lathyrus oleraceus]|uniref:Uncharacterized protein n=1 Tax=Pisum sativum TaxID=3888 RepID=A0A9D4W450_PEA|nr:hypothetical protein KIW84_060974 [Pisum sativum]
MAPWKKFPCKLRYSKLMHCPIIAGISPDRKFLEASNLLMLFRLAISKGRLPLNELWDKLSNNDKEGRPMTCQGMVPLRWLFDMSKYCSIWQFPILGGMPPSSILFDRSS